MWYRVWGIIEILGTPNPTPVPEALRFGKVEGGKRVVLKVCRAQHLYGSNTTA